MSIEFNSNHLVSEILEAEPMPLAAVVALKAIGLHVRMHCLTVDRKTFTFQILSKDLPDGCAYLTLRLIKGSFHTVLWSTFARFDDEYVLYYHQNLDDLRTRLDKVYPVWSIKGVDAVNAKISLGLIDWFLLRKIQSSIKIDSIGVLAFTKLLGRFLFSVPNFIKTHKYLPPMPATFMFNYLTVVCYCPFELSVSALPDFLNQPPDPATGISMKMLLQTLIQPNGSGAWIPGYLPTRLFDGRVFMHSRHCVVTDAPPPSFLSCDNAGVMGPVAGAATVGTEDSHQPTNQPPATSNTAPTTPTAPVGAVGAATSAAPAPSGGAPPALSPYYVAYYQRYEHVLQETAVRVVELQQHPLGARGIIVVLECVHNRAWSAITRYVALDAFKVCLAILAGGQVPDMVCSHFEVYDQEAWIKLVSMPVPSGQHTQPATTKTAPQMVPQTLDVGRYLATVSMDEAVSMPELRTSRNNTSGQPDNATSPATRVHGAGLSVRHDEAYAMSDDSDSDADFLLMDLAPPSLPASRWTPSLSGTPLQGGTPQQDQIQPAQPSVPPAGPTNPSAANPPPNPYPPAPTLTPPVTSTIDFANSCEWGSQYRMRKGPDFYTALIQALQVTPMQTLTIPGTVPGSAMPATEPASSGVGPATTTGEPMVGLG